MLQERLNAIPTDLSGHIQCSKDYWKWEEQATKILEAQGFLSIRWSTSDGDAFGPLMRRCSAQMHGTQYTAFYG